MLIGHMGGPFWAKKDEGAWSVFKGEYDDSVIPLARAEEGRKRLEGLGHAVAWKTYTMQHEVHPDEIADLGAWLRDLTAG